MRRLLLSCALLLAFPTFASASPPEEAGSNVENRPCADPEPAADPAAASAAGDRVTVSTEGSPSLGPDDAKVTLVVFADFECPYCQRAEATLKALEARYGDQLRVVFKNRPLRLHPHAKLAALAALAAQAQGGFWAFHDWLFSGHAVLQHDALVAEAGRLGLDTARFQADLDSARYQAQLDDDVREADRLGVAGTPTFFIDGKRVVGAQPAEVFERMIDAELAR